MTFRTSNYNYQTKRVRIPAPTNPEDEKPLIITDFGIERYKGQKLKYLRVVLSTNKDDVNLANHRVEVDKWILKKKNGKEKEFGMHFGHDKQGWSEYMGKFFDHEIGIEPFFNSRAFMSTGLFAPKQSSEELYESIICGLVNELSVGFRPIAPPQAILDASGRNKIGLHFNTGHYPVEGSWIPVGVDENTGVISHSLAEFDEDEEIENICSEESRLMEAYRSGFKTGATKTIQILSKEGKLKL